MADSGALLERLVRAERAMRVDPADADRALAAIHAAIDAGKNPVVDVPPSEALPRTIPWLWIALGALLVAAALWFLQRPAPQTLAARAALRAAPQFESKPPLSKPEARPVEPVAGQVVDPPVAPRQPSRPRPQPPTEVELIKRAHAALRRGADADAQQALDAHARHYESGALTQERQALRAVVACNTGDTAAGQRFVSSHPRSPHVDRIRSACDLP